MKKIISLVVAIFISVLVSSVSNAVSNTEDQIMTPSVVSEYNQIMLKIYDDIKESQSKYIRLNGFDDKVLLKNQYGIYSISYDYKGEDLKTHIIPLKFSLTILKMGDRGFSADKRGVLNFSFPLLGVKFSGFQNYVKDNGFDIKSLIKKYGVDLWVRQQNYMPYKLVLMATKKSFRVGEDIEFTVTLKNDTKKHLRFKDLNSKTLFFEYDGGSWGSDNISLSKLKSVKDVIIRSGQSISRKLTAEGFYEPGEYEIFCSYAMTYKGIKPTGILKIKVTP